MWDLVSRPGIQPRPPALGAWSLSHGTTREVLQIPRFIEEAAEIREAQGLLKDTQFSAAPRIKFKCSVLGSCPARLMTQSSGIHLLHLTASLALLRNGQNFPFLQALGGLGSTHPPRASQDR